MRVLLDTHVWLWWLLGDRHHLKKSHLKVIEDPQTELLLSPVSVWESHLLIERGRLAVNGDGAAQWIRMAMRTLPVQEARLTFAIAMRSRTMRLDHEDPADRFIAATAAELNIPLATADARLLACKDIQCVR